MKIVKIKMRLQGSHPVPQLSRAQPIGGIRLQHGPHHRTDILIIHDRQVSIALGSETSMLVRAKRLRRLAHPRQHVIQRQPCRKHIVLLVVDGAAQPAGADAAVYLRCKEHGTTASVIAVDELKLPTWQLHRLAKVCQHRHKGRLIAGKHDVVWKINKKKKNYKKKVAKLYIFK